MLWRQFLFSLLLIVTVVPAGLLATPEPAEAFAFGLVPCALNNNNPATSWDDRGPCTLCHFMLGLKNIVIFLRNIMTACAIAVIVAMAIIYITSAGNEGQMQLAKEGIKWSLVGFTIILLAWVGVNFIFTLPIFANNGLVRTGWDTFTCNTTSKAANGSYVAVTPGISNPNGGPAVSLPPGRGGPPETLPPEGGGCNSNPSCEANAGENCSTCPSQCGACGGSPPPPSWGCAQKHYDCVDADVEQKLDLLDSWIWLCRGKGAYLSEVKNCTEKKTWCGDGVVQNPNSAGQSEECDKEGQNGSCPAECSSTCTKNTCLLPPLQ